jgi:hypothetical protein
MREAGMGYTMVLSGPIDRRPQAVSMLRQAGTKVEESNVTVQSRVGPVALHSYDHGFETADGEGWVTALGDLDMVRSVEPLGWVIRAHWEDTGEWKKVGALDVPDPLTELARLRSQLRAAGVVLPGEDK